MLLRMEPDERLSLPETHGQARSDPAASGRANLAIRWALAFCLTIWAFLLLAIVRTWIELPLFVLFIFGLIYLTRIQRRLKRTRNSPDRFERRVRLVAVFIIIVSVVVMLWFKAFQIGGWKGPAFAGVCTAALVFGLWTGRPKWKVLLDAALNNQ